MSKRFEHVSPTEAQITMMNYFREACLHIEEHLEDFDAKQGPFDPRYKALALTHLEIVSMFINKAITHS